MTFALVKRCSVRPCRTQQPSASTGRSGHTVSISCVNLLTVDLCPPHGSTLPYRDGDVSVHITFFQNDPADEALLDRIVNGVHLICVALTA